MEQTQKQISCDRLPPHSQWAKYPWFVAQMQENQMFYTLHNPQLLYRCQIPELIGTQIRASFHGWVVLSKHPTWFLWNPLTLNLIRLPPLIHMKHEPNECFLSSPPDDPTSVFLLSTHGFPILTFCRLDCTRNKLKWANFSYGKELRRIIRKNAYLYDLTCCNGKVYAFNSNDDNETVIEIDIGVEEKKVVMRLLSFVEHPGPSFTRFCTTSGRIGAGRFLKGYCSELFYIDIHFEDETRDTVGDARLYKLDMSNMIWEEMEDLKDAIFFLQVDSQYPVYYTPVITTELAGYIHILDRMGKLLYSYHVKNRTISIASISSLVPTSDMSSWGMLEYRFGGDHANMKQEEDKGDGNKMVKSATISKPVFHSKKRKRTDESYLLNMPFHILECIMEHCVCVEYMNFRATCKLCHLAAPSVRWSNKMTLKRLQAYSLASPWLMVFDKYQGIITLSDVMMGDKYFIKIPRDLMGDIIVHYSRYGWLLIEKDSLPSRTMLFNPFTSDIRELPLENNLDGCCFSAPPTSKDCMVVGCNLQWPRISIHFLGQEQFLRRPYLELGGDVPYSFRFPTFHGKDIYALSNDGRLDVIRETDEEEYTLETVVAKPPAGCVGSSYLVECEQRLLLIIVGTLEESVDLFKLNDLTKEWEKSDGLGKHTIYIADTCFCIEAKTPETENKIYFSGLHNGKIMFYSFKTLSYHTSDGENIKGSLRNFLGTKYPWHPHTWIEPRWS